MKKFLSLFLCSAVLFGYCSGARALCADISDYSDLNNFTYENASNEEKENYTKALEDLKKFVSVYTGNKLSDYFNSSYNSTIFISKNIENPDYEYYNRILTETKNRILEKYDLQDIPLIPIVIMDRETAWSEPLSVLITNSQSLYALVILDDSDVDSVFNQFVHNIIIKHELIANDTEYKNATEDEKEIYKNRLENLREFYLEASSYRDFDNFHYCSNYSTLSIAKDIQNPNYKYYFNAISNAKNKVYDTFGIKCNHLIPTIITGDRNTILMSRLCSAMFIPNPKYIIINNEQANIDGFDKDQIFVNVLAHELVHATLDDNLDPEAVKALPIWFNEGLAAQLEPDNPNYQISDFKFLTQKDLFNDDLYRNHTNRNDIIEFYALYFQLIKAWLDINNNPQLIQEMIQEINDHVHNGTFKESDFKDFLMAHNGQQAIDGIMPLLPQ